MLKNWRDLIGRVILGNRTVMSANLMVQEGSTLTSFLENYKSKPGTFDELMTSEGQIRAHWQTFSDKFSLINTEEQKKLSEKLKRLVHENGLAHDVFSDPDGKAQPWQIDLVPVVISADEWQWLSKAVSQRARLFNELLKDIYSEQKLMQDGSIPARMVFSDTSFIKPCMNVLDDHEPLYFFAVDVARNYDGSWRVIDSHTETPAGLGFAIANRVVHSKVLGDVFEACNILREASFFQKILANLPDYIDTEDPDIAILSHGLQHGDYFSHAYLARYLGYRLIEGSDLRVVGNNIFLKTLNGLLPIDAIIRCVDSEQSDPLELDPSGFLGPPDFVQALRKKPTLITNTLGSGIIENRGLSYHIPTLCQKVLGEELMMFDAERLWLGDPQNRQAIIQNMDGYIIRSVHEGTGRPGVARHGQKLSDLTEDQRKEIINEIQLRGERLIAERVLGFATSPVVGENGLTPAPYAMRLFAIRNGDNYELLPGGLAMTVNPETSVALNAPEGQARDVWVTADENVGEYKSLLIPNINIKEIDRNNANLPSRVADNLYWLGRYVERAEWTMRLMRSAMIQAEEERGLVPDVDAIRKTLELLIAKESVPIELPPEEAGRPQIDELVGILRASNVGTFGLKGILERILQVAQLIRDRLSLEAWEALNTFKNNPLWWQDAVPIRTDDSVDLLNEGIRILAAFSGIIQENMTRNYGWRFLEIGRRLERAVNYSEVLETLFAEKTDEQNEASRLFFILKLADSLITYRSRYRFSPDLSLVLDLLIIDENNPRSLCFQLAEISDHINALPKSSDDAVRTQEQKIILELMTDARLVNVKDIVAVDENGSRPDLKKILEDQINNLPLLSDVLSRRYFSLTDDRPVRVHHKIAT